MDLITLNQSQFDVNIRTAQTANTALFDAALEMTWFYPEMPALYEYEKVYSAINTMLFQYYQVLYTGLKRMSEMKNALVEEESHLIGIWR